MLWIKGFLLFLGISALLMSLKSIILIAKKKQKDQNDLSYSLRSCSQCGTHVPSTELTSVGEKVYCKNCREKQTT